MYRGNKGKESKHETQKIGGKKIRGSSVKVMNTIQRKTKATDNTRNGHNAEFTGKSAKK
jgi:hypothetical protein